MNVEFKSGIHGIPYISGPQQYFIDHDFIFIEFKRLIYLGREKCLSQSQVSK